MVRSCVSCQLSRFVELDDECLDGGSRANFKSAEGDIPNKRDMYTHVTVHAGTIETNVQAKGNAGPRRTAGLTIEAHLET